MVAFWPLVAPPLFTASAEADVDFEPPVVALAVDEDLLLEAFEVLPDLLAPSAGAEAAVFVEDDGLVLADGLLLADDPLEAGAAAWDGACAAAGAGAAAAGLLACCATLAPPPLLPHAASTIADAATTGIALANFDTARVM